MTAVRPVALAILTACGNPGTTGGAAAEILPGTWDCSDGGQITLNGDGSGSTDCAYFVESNCGNDGSVVSSYTITWSVVTDPDVVNDNFGWELSAESRQALQDELGCTVGDGGTEEPLLLATETEVKFGFSVFGEENVFQTLSR